jgi:hypothetical protein
MTDKEVKELQKLLKKVTEIEDLAKGDYRASLAWPKILGSAIGARLLCEDLIYASQHRAGRTV